MYILIWVDDLVILENQASIRTKFVKFLTEDRKYKITDRGVLDWVLGMKLTRDRDAWPVGIYKIHEGPESLS